MKELKTATDFYALGIEKCQSNKYSEAIEAFNKSLALHEHWQSYQGIGSALLQTQQHKEGLEQFYRLHEYGPPWKVLHDLGRELIKKIILT